ncbi:hypothetical protein NL676_006793 [Syzygium grande]|nr:hypothetical protein NL676_006793 [Syzygium grande]
MGRTTGEAQPWTGQAWAGGLEICLAHTRLEKTRAVRPWQSSPEVSGPRSDMPDARAICAALVAGPTTASNDIGRRLM